MDKYGYLTIGAQIWVDYLGDGHKQLRQVCTKTPDIIKNGENNERKKENTKIF